MPAPAPGPGIDSGGVLPGPIGPVAPVAGIVSVFPPTIVKVPFRVPELTILALIPTGPAFAFPVPIVGITPGINATFVTVPPTDAIQDTPEEKLMVGVLRCNGFLDQQLFS